MNGNKPFDGSPAEFAAWSPFTARMAAHPKVAYFPYPGEALLVTMVVDQILVGDAAAADDDVKDALAGKGAVATGVAVFDENDRPGGQNVSIWQLGSTPGDKPHADVAEVVWAVREVLTAKGIGLEQVAPNHVLIPAANYHSCPWSPPDEPHRDPLDLGAADGSVTVTVIDSGYQDGGPIKPRVSAATYGLWFARDASKPGGYAWVKEKAAKEGFDPLDQDGDGRLDALVGHANFVAGVIAQMCPVATINVVSHNGAFVDSDSSAWPIPTEASVALSLWNSRTSDVINVGFAFPTLPAIPPLGVVTDGPASWALDLVLQSMHDRPAHVIVAPAGNQHSTRPQYPAAFHDAYANVIGVGSVGPDGPSRFSNHGPWVTCCTEGEDVTSTFISDGGQPWSTEDAEPPGFPNEGQFPVKDFHSGWASWSGTSFAAPTVAGAIARLKAGDLVNPLAAWNELQEGRPSPPELDMGVLISGLLA